MKKVSLFILPMCRLSSHFRAKITQGECNAKQNFDFVLYSTLLTLHLHLQNQDEECIIVQKTFRRILPESRFR